MLRASRYGPLTAAGYDAASGEWPVYRAGRAAAVDALGLAPGASVLDLGCGTGLSLPLLLAATGPSGAVVAVDASAAMLARAGRRVAGRGWTGVRLLRADVATVGTTAPGALAREDGGAHDAVLAVYALSLVRDWPAAWAAAVAAARPGARAAVVDMARPRGTGRALAPLAAAACRLGGADIDAHPWTAVERGCTDVTALSLRGGHVQVRVGTLP